MSGSPIDLESLATAAGSSAQAAAVGARGPDSDMTLLYTGCLGMLVMIAVSKVGGLSGILSMIGLGPKKEPKADEAASKPEATEGSKTTGSTEAPEWPAKRHFPADAHPSDNSVDKVWTAGALAAFDGVEKPMYICVLGIVYDVSPSENFVPEKGYGSLWGGRDATYALSTMSLERSDANKLPPLGWDLNASSEQEKAALVSWRDHFADKYTVVGKHEAYVGFDWSPLNGIENPKKKKEAEKKKRETEAALREAEAAAAAAAAGGTE